MSMFDRIQHEIDARTKAEGITPADVMELPDLLRRVMNRITRRGTMTLTELAAELHLSADEARQAGASLMEKGFLKSEEREGETVYSIRFGRKRTRQVPLDVWQALDGKLEKE